MSRDDIQKLLGGYATGTLTPEEQRVLFEAALEDQELFDALAREEALREVVSDPASRARLLAAVEERPARWYGRWSGFWPKAIPLAAAAAIVLAVGLTMWQRGPAPEPRPEPLAKVELPAAPVAQSPKLPALPPPPVLKPAAPAVALRIPGVSTATPAPPPPPPTPAPAAAPAVIADSDGVFRTPMLQQAQSQSQPQAQFAPVIGGMVGAPFLPRTVPVSGTVTDATGAGVNSATVELKALDSGQVATVRTNERGEFRLEEVPGRDYQLSATAPGFNPATRNVSAPVGGTPEPVNLRLEVGVVSQSVEVSAEARAIAPQTLFGSSGEIHGVVKDPAGAVVPAASVTVKSLATGTETHTSTNERGEYSAMEDPGGHYQVTVSAPGFVTEARAATPGQVVNVTLRVASMTESVVVGGLRPGLAGGGGGRGIANAKQKAAAVQAPDYRVLARQANGKLSPVAADGSAPAGTALTLRVTPRANGYLRIEQADGKVLASLPAQRGKAIDTRLPDYPTGPVELRLFFSTSPVEATEQAASATITFTIR